MCICHKCQDVPYCRVLFKGRTPTILGILLCCLFIAVALWGLIRLNDLGSEERVYRDGVDYDKSCFHYCGQEHSYTSLTDDTYCCLAGGKVDCIYKETCFNNRIDEFSSESILPMTVFFTAYGFVLLYSMYYLLRCIWAIKRRCLRRRRRILLLPPEVGAALLEAMQQQLIQEAEQGAV